MSQSWGFNWLITLKLEMGKRVVLVQCSTTLFILAILLCSVWGAAGVEEEPNEAKIRTSTTTSTVQKDITTPLTTVPTINFMPSSTAPVLNPNSIPETSPTLVPFATPSTSSPVNSGASWCVASQTAPRSAVQIALDYACGHGGADCSAIQPGGSCYYPDTLHGHASYAFNNYYQKKPIPNSCNFGGTGVITSTNPSSGTCQYPSTSTSSSVLDTANQNVSTVFGVGPPGSPISGTAFVNKASYLSLSMCFILLLLRYG